MWSRDCRPPGELDPCLTFLHLVTEQVDLLSSADAAGRPIHSHDLQVGGVWRLWGQRVKRVSDESFIHRQEIRTRFELAGCRLLRFILPDSK